MANAEFVINKSILTKALTVAAAAGKKKPITFSSADGCLVIEGYGEEGCYSTALSLEHTPFSAVSVASRALMRMVRSLPGDDVNLKIDGGIEISSGRIGATLAGWEGEPSGTQLDKDRSWAEITIPGVGTSQILSAAKRIRHALSKDSHRESLTHYCFSGSSEGIYLVATDTHRLAVQRLGDYDRDTTLLLPSSFVALANALKLGESKLEITQTQTYAEDWMRLSNLTDNITLRSRHCKHTYPNWQHVVPNPEHPISASIDSKDLSAAVRRALIFGADNANRIYFDFTTGEVEVSARSEELGNYKESVPCICDKPIRLAVNGNYVIEALAAAG